MSDLQKEYDKLEKENVKLGEQRRALREQARANRVRMDEIKAQLDAESKVASMSGAEKRALAQTLHAEGIASGEKFEEI